MGIPEALVRLSVGIENPDDLIADLRAGRSADARRLRRRQPPAVREGGAAAPGARSARRTWCWSTRGSTTTTGWRASSTTSSASRRPRTGSRSAPARTPRRPRACWSGSSRCWPPRRPTGSSSTATPTRRSPPRSRRSSSACRSPTSRPGLRSFDRSMPEEVNRVLVDAVADLLLCPSDVAVRNLAAEGVTARRARGGRRDGRRGPPVRPARRPASAVPIRRTCSRRIHREANTRQPALGRLVAALSGLGERVILPLHPRTRAARRRRRPRVRRRPSRCASRPATSSSRRCCAAPGRWSPTPAARRRRRTSTASRA